MNFVRRRYEENVRQCSIYSHDNMYINFVRRRYKENVRECSIYFPKIYMNFFRRRYEGNVGECSMYSPEIHFVRRYEERCERMQYTYIISPLNT